MGTCPSCGADLPAAARFCPSCGTALQAVPAPAVEERKLATVLFADLVGSTAQADAQDPERTRARLDRFYDAMAAEIEAAGGTVEKFAGDAVMAVFGAPAAQEDHAERALHAALAMHRRLHALFGDELALRIGVNSGDVVVGRPREGSSFVSGDSVNSAARLEQAAEAGEVLAGERTAALARGAFEFGEARVVEAKGKENGLPAFRVSRALTLMRPRGVGGLQRAFVGRDSELDLLLATYTRAVHQGEPHFVTIMADAGVGKTRLVRELWERLSTETPEPMRRTGRCLAYGHGITYWPLGEILKEHLGILEGDPPNVVLDRLSGREILGLALGLDVAGELHPLVARDRLHDGWVEFLAGLAAERPVVMLIEDLHWAEEPLLDLLERVVREVRGPLFVIGTARPELLDARPSWGGGTRNASLLWVEPLRADDAARMLDELLATELPEQLRDVVIERAEGNPFFVEELIGTLIDRGVLERQNGDWHVVEQPESFDIPDSVQAVVAARMDLLPPGEKAALQAAAVTGRIFWTGPVVELLEGGEPDFALLEERDFIRQRTASTMAGEREFVFKHQLTREVAYASVPKARRARLHAQFADWLERMGNKEELAALLAHHYAEAARPEDADLAWHDEAELAGVRTKAAHWLRRAGELAIGRYELDDAIELLSRAAELETDEVAISELWREIGRANALGFRGVEFWDAMERSLAVCTDPVACGETYAELAYQTAVRAGMWQTAPDRDLVDGWIERAVALAEPGSPALVKALAARVIWSKDAPPDDARTAKELADRLGDAELRSIAFDACQVAAWNRHDFGQALEWVEKQFTLIDQLQDPERIAEFWESAVAPYALLGRFPEAREVAAKFDEATQSLSPHHRLHGVALMSEVEELSGDWQRLRELSREAEERVAANLRTPCVRNMRTLLVCSAAHVIGGDDREARRLEESAEALQMHGYDQVLLGPRLRIAIQRDDLDRVRALLALQDSGRGKRVTYGMSLSSDLVRLDGLALLGEWEQAAEEAEALLAPGSYLEPFALRTIGRARRQPELIRQALGRFEEMQLGWHAEQTRELLAS